jgi:AraC-like DNA-binding protein
VVERPDSGSADIAGTSIASTEGHAGDPISDVLENIRLRGALFFLWEPGLPYGITVANGSQLSRHIVPGTDCVISYHIVTEGPCWASVGGEEPVCLQTGDTLLLPQGDAYIISDTPRQPEPDRETESIEFFRALSAGEVPPLVTAGGPQAGNSKLICGFLGCNPGPFDPLLTALPRMIRVPAPGAGRDPLSSLIDFALTETTQSRGGERSLLMRLSELMFVEVLRRYLRESPRPQSGWLEGLRDPLVGRALGLLHRDIAAAWTLDELARRIGASRSTLAERFTDIVGVPPIQYVTGWRMQVAANRLLDESNKIYSVAREVGYESEAAFSRAFKRVVGVSPKNWRERHRTRTLDEG